MATNKSIEEEACNSAQGERRGDKLHIDFDYLETLMVLEKRQLPALQVFPHLRLDSAAPPHPPAMTKSRHPLLGHPPAHIVRS